VLDDAFSATIHCQDHLPRLALRATAQYAHIATTVLRRHLDREPAAVSDLVELVQTPTSVHALQLLTSPLPVLHSGSIPLPDWANNKIGEALAAVLRAAANESQVPPIHDLDQLFELKIDLMDQAEACMEPLHELGAGCALALHDIARTRPGD